MTGPTPTNCADACTTFTSLPPIGAPLGGGIFAGLTTLPDGQHMAVALLPNQGTDLDWPAATAWAEGLQATLPTRSVAALLFANLRQHLRKEWHWTSETHEEFASFAWYCHFLNGYQYLNHKSYEAHAVAVRLIPISA